MTIICGAAQTRWTVRIKRVLLLKEGSLDRLVVKEIVAGSQPFLRPRTQHDAQVFRHPSLHSFEQLCVAAQLNCEIRFEATRQLRVPDLVVVAAKIGPAINPYEEIRIPCESARLKACLIDDLVA